MNKRTRDWVLPGVIIGNEGDEKILFACSYKDVLYFDEDTPVPFVGPEDEVQPVYSAYLLPPSPNDIEGDSLVLETLCEFTDKDSYATFLGIVGRAAGIDIQPLGGEDDSTGQA